MLQKSKEQTLVDLIFNMVLVSTEDKVFCKKPRGEKMAWVANTLRKMGFDTPPVGMSWGMLISPETREKIGQPNTENIDN